MARQRRDVREAQPLASRPHHRRLPRLDRGGRARGDRRGPRRLPLVVAASRGAARRLLHEGGGGDRGTRGADRPGHDRRDGEAAPRGAPRIAAGGADPPLLGRRGMAAGRRAVRAVGRRPAAFHAPAPARRRRPHHAVELPDRDPRVEARAGTHLREHARPQARVRGAAHGSPRRRVLRRGGAAARRPQRAHRSGLEGRRRDRLERRRPRDLLHGLRAGRPLRARRGDRTRLPRAARARRAQPATRHRRRRARPGGRGRLRRRLLVGGAEVHRDAAHPGTGLGLRLVPRRSSSPASPPGRWATPRTRKSRSARS